MERTRKETMDESFKDGLTDLANRKFFDYQYPRMAATAKRLGQSLSVFFIDLNKLKQTNDTYGHEAGDDLIRNLAFRIRRTVRSGSEDLVARYGGDEIVIVMPHTNEETARKTAQKLLESLETPIQIMQQKPETEEGGTGQTNSIKLKMTASIGVHVVRPSDWLNTKTNTVDIIKCADRAAYAAKHATLQHTQRVLQNRLQTGAPASLNDDTSACIFYDQNTRVSDEQSPINNALRATITKMEAELLARSTQKKSE
jgi:two-component system cell cycle response regulator